MHFIRVMVLVAVPLVIIVMLLADVADVLRARFIKLLQLALGLAGIHESLYAKVILQQFGIHHVS